MAFKLSNFARMSLIQSAALADTTLFVSAADGDLLPALGVSDSAPAVLFDADNEEIVYITAEANGTLTVTRAQEATAARDWPSGTKLIHTPTAAVFLAAIAATTQFIFTGTATNITNAYTLDVGVGNGIPTLSDGEQVSFLIPASNTGAATLNVTNGVSSTGAIAIRKENAQALQSGDLTEDWLALLRYDAVNDVWLISNITSTQFSISEINEGPVPAVNRHPNGRLDAWNNGTSFSSPVTLTETADGWFVEHDGTIGTFTVNQQTFTLGQTDVPGDPKYFLRWDHSSTGSGSALRRLRVPVPRVNWRGEERAIRRVWLKADSARTVTGRIIQHFGTGGSPSADVTVDSEAWSVTTSWQAFDLAVTLPSVSGKTLGSGGDDAILLTLDLPLNTTMTIDVALDDFRPGALIGEQSATFPLPTWLGGTGGSFEDLNSLGSAIDSVVHIAGAEDITGAKTFQADLTLEGITPKMLLNETDAGVDEKLWDILVGTTNLLIRTRTDADGAGVTAVTVDRAAGTALTRVLLGCPLALPDGSAALPALYFPGLATNTGLYTVTGEFAFAWAGVAHVFWNATRMRIVPSVELSAGSAATPAQLHTSDSNTGRYWIGADNIGESAGGVLRFDWNTTRLQFASTFDAVLGTGATEQSSIYSVGYRGTPPITTNAVYAFPRADAGSTIYHDETTARTWTIPANGSIPHPIGTAFVIDNTGHSGGAPGAITVAITTDELRRGDGTAGTGSRVVPADGVATIRKVTTTRWVISGIFT